MTSISPSHSDLDWRDGFFNFPQMVRIRTIGDGSCYFHAIIQAFSKIYITGKMPPDPETGIETPIDRMKFIMDLRNELADNLAAPSNPSDPNSPTNYQLLSRGQLESISKSPGLERYSLTSLQDELRTRTPVDYVYHELVSNSFNRDIYILDLARKDVYVIGDDFDILWKGRPSVVILYDQANQHFDLVGLRLRNGSIGTYFTADDVFIQSIRERLKEKIANGRNDRSNKRSTPISTKAKQIPDYPNVYRPNNMRPDLESIYSPQVGQYYPQDQANYPGPPNFSVNYLPPPHFRHANQASNNETSSNQMVPNQRELGQRPVTQIPSNQMRQGDLSQAPIWPTGAQFNQNQTTSNINQLQENFVRTNDQIATQPYFNNEFRQTSLYNQSQSQPQIPQQPQMSQRHITQQQIPQQQISQRHITQQQIPQQQISQRHITQQHVPQRQLEQQTPNQQMTYQQLQQQIPQRQLQQQMPQEQMSYQPQISQSRTQQRQFQQEIPQPQFQEYNYYQNSRTDTNNPVNYEYAPMNQNVYYQNPSNYQQSNAY